VSRHHVLPPIVHAPEPPKPKETRRRRRAGRVQDSDETDEAEEALWGAPTVPGRAALPQQQATPAESGEPRVPSTTGKFSDDTLRAILELQEASQPAVTDSAIPKDV
jgi:hypothetical protein